LWGGGVVNERPTGSLQNDIAIPFCQMATTIKYHCWNFALFKLKPNKMKSLVKILIGVMMSAKSMGCTSSVTSDTTSATGQIPSDWAQHTVEDTVNVPLEVYWGLSFKLNLEEIGSVGNYEDLPKITKTTPVVGNFAKLGDSRRVHFNTGQTLLETIIDYQNPGSFAYELSELEIDLKRAAKRARGHFQHFALPNGQTRVVWTYGFDSKNFVFRWFINRYIKKTHQFWMKDTLAEMKRQTEAMYQASSKQ
jgi:hypothetical protein